MQIGIDLGASKIESVLLDKDGKEHFRGREKSPQNYNETLVSITKIVNNIEKKFSDKLKVGVGHPGSINIQTGLLHNANNSPWMNNESFQKDISKKLDRNVYCENDANCFALSEATDGFASQYKVVFGVILGSGCGGGLVVDKKIITGSNNYTGEWGHNALPFFGNLKDENLDLLNASSFPNINIEKFISGKGLESLYFEKFNKIKTTKEIFINTDKHEEFIKNFYNRLARSLSILINIIDPDAIVFGGGVSNEIKDLDYIKKMSFEFAGKKNIKTNFLNAKFGDASGVRGAALLGRSNSI
jgi:fructokinase